MRNTFRPIAAFVLLGCAACATDGITGPQAAPEAGPLAAEIPAPAAEVPAPAAAARPRSVILRCGGSFRTDMPPPLYVVNGEIMEAAADVLPADIERIEILRGAEAVSRYGTRAANGVVLITTRSARA